MFASIARRYDWGNDILSMGTHRLWRRSAVQALTLKPGMRVLDLCTGTGDLAFALSRELSGKGTVVGLDFVESMLQIARTKNLRLQPATEAANAPQITFLCGDAMSLPFCDEEMDVVTVAFGIRNVDSPLGCLKEMKRVLKPGGQVMILEFGQPRAALFAPLYRFYSSRILPYIGGLATGNISAYHYLNRTSRTFPAGNAFLNLLEEAGFSQRKAKPLFGGLAYIYTGKIGASESVGKSSKYQMNGHGS